MPSKHSQAAFWVSKGVFDSLTTFAEFEQRVTGLLDTNTKAEGDAFEIFVEAYLATQPAMQSEDSWPVGTIPIEIRESLNLPSDSKGIDGVYRSLAGHYVPYQVKFRSKRPALGFNEVAPFLGITERATDRLLITNCDSIAVDVKNRTGLRSLRGVDFDTMTQEDFELISSWLKSRPAKRPPLTPLLHQTRALDDISTHLKEHDRGTVVMACGTGKTLVALWAAERSGARSILVLVPSLTLMQQTLEEWSRHNSWGRGFTYLCVCSDPQVDLKNDEIEIETSDLPFRVDTDPALVSDFLAQTNSKAKVIFSTYQSSQVVAQATKGNHSFDIGIFDEAHKTTGPSAGRFATALSEDNISIKKRLFFTATPKHYDLKHRDKEGDFKVVSMDDEAVYGKRIHTLTFGEAASAGIICPYKVVVTLIDKEQVDDFALKNGITLVEGDAINAKWAANQIAISNAIEHTSASKVITFHSRVKTAREFASDESRGVKQFLKDFSVFHVHGKQRSNDRKDLITKFRNAERSLITNARCLTEGIDVPAVDMVAFIDPRQSKIDIAQAIGRAMRKPRNGTKTHGYIVVPVYAENSDTASLEEAIKDEGFDNIALILGALLEQDEELVDIVRELKQDKGQGKPFNPRRLAEKLELIGPYVQLDTLAQNIFVSAVDRLASSWYEWYGRLISYKKREGSCLVPLKHLEDGLRLGAWVGNQREQRNSLSVDRIRLLDDLGFSWDTYSAQWNEGYGHLCEFKRVHGHCSVPKRHFAGEYPLGQWVSVQRGNRDNLSPDRTRLLTDLGFIFDPLAEQWDRGFKHLVQYKEREGNCQVPQRHVEHDFLLGWWVGTQRMESKRLSTERRERLSSLGFIWDPLSEQWEDAFKCFLKFKEREGHTRVPAKHLEDNFLLGTWVQNQRRKMHEISDDRQKRLNAAGFIWDPLSEQWEDAFKCFLKFKEREGHTRVPSGHLEGEFALGQWVGVQRKLGEKLSDERRGRLAEANFIWSQFDALWEDGFLSLVRYRQRTGDTLVPKSHVEDGYKLGLWVQIQRRRMKRNEMTEERKQRLNELHFVWQIASHKK
jgi:superfamily II DNA or RNA helicase